MSPVVSVILPNYNHARFLRRRIDGVLNQTHPALEVHLLDDASTDDSRAVMEAYRNDPRVTLDFRESNSGSPFAQWNRGIERARGRYLWIAESDDEAEPGLVAGLVGLMEAHPTAVVAFCASRTIDAEGRTLGVAPDPARDRTQARFASGFVRPGREELTDQLLAVCNGIPNASSALFRTEAVRAAGAADATYRLMGDWQFYARVLALGRVAFTPERWNRYRCHDQSAREKHRRTGRRWLELCRFYDWVLDQDLLGEAEKSGAAMALGAELVRDMRLWRSTVGTFQTLARLLEVVGRYPWLRRPVGRALKAQVMR